MSAVPDSVAVAPGVPERPGGVPSVEVCRDAASRAEWDAFVERHPDATMQHLSAWADVMRNAFGRSTTQLAARQGGRLVGILPLVRFDTWLFGRFAVSMPFLNYGGVVADSGAAADALLEAGIAEARDGGAAYLELRHDRRRFEHLAVQSHKVAMVLQLEPTVDGQFAAIDRKLRNQVRKAEKSGLTVQVGGVELLDAFYGVMAENMRDLGTPVHGPGFFRAVLDAFPQRTRILCVRHGSQAVAASFVMSHRDRLEVPWASALRAFNPMCPNVLLYWEMLRFGIDQGYRTFDFGRSSPDSGTYKFKEQWGATPVPLFWEYWLREGMSLPDRSPNNPKFARAIAAWQRLPVAITRLIGPPIVRNIP